MTLTTNVLIRGAAKFNMAGQFLGYPLNTIGEKITDGLKRRLHHYAEQRLFESGFNLAVVDWDVEVYTLDGNDKPTDRSYCVRFKNAKGGFIEVIGILTKSGWPMLDHGFEIGSD